MEEDLEIAQVMATKGKAVMYDFSIRAFFKMMASCLFLIGCKTIKINPKYYYIIFS